MTVGHSTDGGPFYLRWVARVMQNLLLMVDRYWYHNGGSPLVSSCWITIDIMPVGCRWYQDGGSSYQRCAVPPTVGQLGGRWAAIAEVGRVDQARLLTRVLGVTLVLHTGQ